MLQLDLKKSAGKLQLSLEKAGFITPPTVELAFDLDVSESYEDEHLDGTTNLLITRLVPWGMVFDPDKKLDVFTFSDGEDHAYYVGDVNEHNYKDFVPRYVIKKVPGWNGGTDYAPVLRKNLELFGWIQSAKPAEAKKSGFFGRMFGKPQPAAASEASTPRKSLVLFNTDGANNRGDRPETSRLFEQMERDKLGMYVMFIGVSNQPGTFDYLQKLADQFTNCGLTIIPNVREWVTQDDDAINQELITPELVAWLQA